MSLSSAYNPQENEDTIYTIWENSGYFNPDVCVEKNVIEKNAEVFSVMMPPPNVTGVLHLGHAFENTLMDIQVRYQRMNKKRTLFVPGTDHAAVATQAKVEKVLIDKGIENPRKELGREKLLEEIKTFAKDSQNTIIKQVKKMGSSCDWSRLAYTFDETRSKTVTTVFGKMYEDGLIYQGYRVVNWSVKGQSTCSDDELVHVPRKAKLYFFKYAKDFPITIATTRPETKLGDSAVAVHPGDKRYKDYIGKSFTVDVGAENPRTIKIIADEGIDPEYGTGALGVTPAHSQIDYEMYENNDIDLIQVIGLDGKMTKEAGSAYEGKTAEQARELFVSWLETNNLLEKVEDIDQNVSTSDRFKDIVEAIPMRQWFIAVNKKIPGREKTLKELMKESVVNGHNNNPDKKINITPDRFNKIYFNWIDNLRDWCISRQIWWGHRIPIWYKVTKEEKDAWDATPDQSLTLFNQMNFNIQETIFSETEPRDNQHWIQDPDTLDTWFSSGTWTFSTLGWPEVTPDFKTYHPTTWMQMGYEILFFWMARMILMSTYVLDDIPFKDVYIHGILRDEQGRKFSKSLGNGIDPLDMIEKYGTDALRLTLLSDVTAGNDSRFYEEKVEYYRNMVNKLWNVSRYILQNTNEARIIETQPKPITIADEWILSRLNTTISQVRANLDSYAFSPCIELIRDFMWNDFADWYIEVSKIEGEKEETLLYILQTLLKLMHPFAPFVTEALWAHMHDNTHNLLLVNAYPTTDNTKYNEEEFEILKATITSIRHARAERKIEPKVKMKATIQAENHHALFEENTEVLLSLARLESIIINEQPPENTLSCALPQAQIDLHLEGAIDLEADKERIQKEKDNLTHYIQQLEKKLSNPQFVNNAPATVIEGERTKLKEAQDKLNRLDN